MRVLLTYYHKNTIKTCWFPYDHTSQLPVYRQYLEFSFHLLIPDKISTKSFTSVAPIIVTVLHWISKLLESYFVLLFLWCHCRCLFSLSFYNILVNVINVWILKVVIYSFNVWRKSVFDIYFTGFGAALTTVLPVLFKYCYKYCYSDSRKLWAVMKGGGLAL